MEELSCKIVGNVSSPPLGVQTCIGQRFDLDTVMRYKAGIKMDSGDVVNCCDKCFNETGTKPRVVVLRFLRTKSDCFELIQVNPSLSRG